MLRFIGLLLSEALLKIKDITARHMDFRIDFIYNRLLSRESTKIIKSKLFDAKGFSNLALPNSVRNSSSYKHIIQMTYVNVANLAEIRRIHLLALSHLSHSLFTI